MGEMRSFGLKYYFFLKKIYKNSFELKLLPKVVRLGHLSYNMANTAVVNNGFIIFLKVIAVVMDSGFIIF